MEDLGQIREDIGGLKMSVAAIAASIARVEGHLQSQLASQDTRVGDLAIELGSLRGAAAASQRWHLGLVALVSTALSSVMTFAMTHLSLRP